MSRRALVLAYHAVEPGPAPLCLAPDQFREHLDLIADASVRVVELGQLADELDAGGPPEPSVAITFDDGFASVVDRAAPLLVERALPATVFCVAGHLGGLNDWPTEPRSAPRRPLADAAALSELVRQGIDVGSHGMTHLPLAQADQSGLEREVVHSKAVLGEAVGAPVRWYAYPRNSLPGVAGRALVERTYAGACAGGNRSAGPGADRFRLPRIEAHYLRRPARLRRVLEGGEGYLALRRTGARLRRLALD